MTITKGAIRLDHFILNIEKHGVSATIEVPQRLINPLRLLSAAVRPWRKSIDERGLSQSAETAILIAGAVTVALVVVGLVTAYVRTKMAQI